MRKRLTNHQKSQLQGRVSHYISSFRMRRNFSQKECAEDTGYTEAQIKFMESKKVGSIVSAVDTLQAIASLEEMDISEFVAYLRREKLDKDQAAKLQPWQHSLIEAFADIPLELRRKFIHGFLHNQKGNPGFEESLELFMFISNLDAATKAAMRQLISCILDSKEKSQ